MDPGGAATRRYLFLMMHKRRVWARFESESSRDLERWVSCATALLSVAGCVMPYFVVACSTGDRTEERAGVRLSWGLTSMVPEWPMGTATNFSFPW